jgi:hypothetical protein
MKARDKTIITAAVMTFMRTAKYAWINHKRNKETMNY